MITLYAYTWVPDFAQGYVRDLRVRWALEEAGLPYVEKLISHSDRLSPDYLTSQPFGQVPAIESDGAILFESGAIVLHIARLSERLMPSDVRGRGRTEAWMFAALNTVEPHVAHLADIDLFCAGENWAKERRPSAITAIEQRADKLQAWLGDSDYLDGSFSAGDLLMSDVFRSLGKTDILDKRPPLKAYLDRCTARPAFQKALADQLRSFEGNAPPGM
jgi:glutathione S-transferase